MERKADAFREEGGLVLATVFEGSTGRIKEIRIRRWCNEKSTYCGR